MEARLWVVEDSGRQSLPRTRAMGVGVEGSLPASGDLTPVTSHVTDPSWFIDPPTGAVSPPVWSKFTTPQW